MVLLSKLNLLKGSLSKQDFVPILSNFCFTGEEIIAFDGIQAASIKYDSDFICGLPAQLLLKLLAGYNSDNIKMLEQDNDVELKCGKSRVKLGKLPESDFIFQLPKVITGIGCKFDVDFIEGIKKCLVSVSDRDFSQQEGITVINKDSKTILYSKNNTSASSYELKVTFSDKDFQSILSLNFCNQLLLWHSKFENSKIKEILFCDDFVKIDFDEGYICTKLHKTSSYLDFADVIKNSLQARGNVFEVPHNLENILDRCILMIESEKDSSIRINIEKDVMSFHAEGKYGVIDEDVILDDDIGTFIFNIDPVLFKKILPFVQDLSISNIDNRNVIIGESKGYINLLSCLLS